MHYRNAVKHITVSNIKIAKRLQSRLRWRKLADRLLNPALKRIYDEQH